MRHRVRCTAWLMGAVAAFVSPVTLAAAGRTPGAFEVNAIGAATYTIPIWTPAGAQGMQPSLALTYNSQADNDVAGVGWSLAGLGEVSRCQRNLAQDGTPQVLNDRYCLNGQRLRLYSGANYGDQYSTYQTELADFSLTTAMGDQTTRWFKVQAKSGLTYEYGNSTDSRIGLAGTTTVWLLNKVSDRNGNSYTVTYGPNQAGTVGTTVPLSITWGNSNQYSATFGYDLRATRDALTGYYFGAQITNTNRLRSVTVKNGATVVRYYSLGFDGSPVTNRSRLRTVTECADSAMTNCLAPTAISYFAGAAGVSSTTSTAVSGTSSLKGAVDLDGDGRTDIVYVQNSVLYAALGTSNGFGTPINTGALATGWINVGNWTGSGKQDILVAESGYWYRYNYSNGSFVRVSTGLAVNSATQVCGLGDVNGDGLADLVTGTAANAAVCGGYGPATYYVNFNTSTNGVLSFAPATVIASFPSGNWCSSSASYCIIYPNGVADVNSNGTGEMGIGFFGVYGGPGGGAHLNESVRWYSWNGTAFTYTYGPSTAATQPTKSARWNDDGCDDTLTPASSGATFTVQIAACNGTTAATLNGTGTLVGAYDWDGDGRTDALVRTSTNYLGVYLSTGTGIDSLITTSVPLPAGTSVSTGDIDGDGLGDLILANSSSIQYILHNGVTGGRSDYANSIVDGFGVGPSLTYATLSDSSVYTAGTGAVAPEVDTTDVYGNSKAFNVVKTASSTDGNGSSFTQTYSYATARRMAYSFQGVDPRSGSPMTYKFPGRGFEGFQLVKMIDSRTGQIRKTYRLQTFPNTGMVYEDDLYQSDGVTLISQMTATPATPLQIIAGANNQSYFPYMSSTSMKSYEFKPGNPKNGQLITTATTTFTAVPDNYGNFPSITQTTTDNDTDSPYYTKSWTRAISLVYFSADSTNWCVGLLNTSQETDSTTQAGESAVVRSVQFNKDVDASKCRAYQKITEPLSSTMKVTEQYGFDSFGNVNSVSVTGKNPDGTDMAARTSSMSWGTRGIFMESQTANIVTPSAHGESVGAGYNYDLSFQTSQSDPNGVAIQWSPDSFGRRTQETLADGTYTTFAYANCADTSACFNAQHRITRTETHYNKDNTVLTSQLVGIPPLLLTPS